MAKMNKDIKTMVKGGLVGYLLSFVVCAIPYVGDFAVKGYTTIREMVGGKN